MLPFTLISLIMLGQVEASSSLSEKCSIREGEKISFLNTANTIRSLKDQDLIKGEFETSLSFQTRKAEAITSMGMDQPILLGGLYDPKQVQYDADNQRFLIKSYAWDNTGVGWYQAFGVFNEHGLKAHSQVNHGVFLKKQETITGSYEAANAYGVKKEVTQIARVVYSIFDRQYSDPYSGKERTWATDEVAIDKLRSPAVSLSVPIEKAKEFRKSLKVGFLVQLKTPYIVESIEVTKPTIRHPSEVTEIDKVLIGDLLCAIITDANGTVLRVINTAY